MYIVTALSYHTQIIWKNKPNKNKKTGQMDAEWRASGKRGTKDDFPTGPGSYACLLLQTHSYCSFVWAPKAGPRQQWLRKWHERIALRAPPILFLYSEITHSLLPQLSPNTSYSREKERERGCFLRNHSTTQVVVHTIVWDCEVIGLGVHWR